MIKIANKVCNSSLLLTQKQGFSNLMIQNTGANPIKDRVMSTPTWPVPYYQRIKKKTANLSLSDFEAGDGNWFSAKRALNLSLKGRQIVEYTENNVKTNTYLIKKDDCQSMVKAYVDDVGQFLGLANRQNVRILGGKNLI